MNRSLPALAGALLVSLSLPSFAQDGIAHRIDRGTMIGSSGDGVPRYRADSGWDAASYVNARWAVEYGTTFGDLPWIVVHEADRTNAAFTAAANKLVLDLGGKTYTVRPFLASGKVQGGRVMVADRHATGAFLKIANGTFENTFGTNSRLLIGETGAAGRLFVENAHVRTYVTQVGSEAPSQSVLTLDAGGRLTAASNLLVGSTGQASIVLRGSGSELTAGHVEIGNNQRAGAITLDHADARLLVTTSGGNTSGDMEIGNVTAFGDPGPALRVLAGTAIIEGDLELANAGVTTAVVSIEGGPVAVRGRVNYGTDATDTTGGKVFLRGGRFEVADPTALAPAAQKQFYWDSGTLAFSGADITLSDVRLTDYTREGAASYGGDRAAGSIATGQVLDAAGKLTLSGGTIGLAGGTIRAGTELNVNAPVAGHGTLDAVVTGMGAIDNPTANALAIGALGGSNAVTSDGELQVGSRNADATFAGTSSGAGAFVKVGTGTQTITGGVTNAGGVEAQQGALAFEGAGQRLDTSALLVNDAATVRFANGATGRAASATIGASSAAPALGRLTIEGAGSSLAVTGDLTNHGLIELAEGTLDIGGSFVNHGRLINNGTLDAVVTGAGTVTGGGSFVGPVTVAAGATLAPGNSPGTTTFTDLTLGPGGAFELELAAATGTAGVDWDLASVTSLLSVTATAANPYLVVLKSLDGTFEPGALAGFDPTRPHSWKFVAASIANPQAVDLGAFRIDATDFANWNDLAGGSLQIAAAGDGLYVGFAPQPAAVPEPGPAVLMAVAGLTAGALRSARKRSRKTPA